MESPSLGIADWEFSRGTGWLGLEDDSLSGTSPLARVLLDTLAPYLAPVTEAVSPLLAAHGLSPADATLEALLAVDGLADELLLAASAAVARVEGGVGPVLQAEPRESALSHSLQPAAHALSEGTLPEGWALHVESGPRHLKLDESGDPCYPDVPVFELILPGFVEGRIGLSVRCGADRTL